MGNNQICVFYSCSNVHNVAHLVRAKKQLELELGRLHPEV